MTEFLLQIGVFLFLIGLGLFVGRYVERRHLADLQARELATRSTLVTQLKSFPDHTAGPSPPQLLVAEVVIATDYLKSFLAGLRNLFGGEVRSYQSMLVRARREATLRIVEKANRLGYNAVCNLRLETADIGGGTTSGKRSRKVMATILASATAYHAHSRP